VFPGGDGHLYLQDLGDDDESDEADVPSARRMVAWNASGSGIDLAILNDPIRPVVPALGGRLFVALDPGFHKGEELSIGKSEIWWITLNADRTAIEDAGRLIAPERPDRDGAANEERKPNLVSTPDGRIALAYLTREPGAAAWSLCVVPVTIDPKTGAPVASASESRPIARDSAVTVPAFSADGRWLYHVPRELTPGKAPTRFSVAQALARQQ
jgi:hypothetical protein